MTPTEIHQCRKKTDHACPVESAVPTETTRRHRTSILVISTAPPLKGGPSESSEPDTEPDSRIVDAFVGSRNKLGKAHGPSGKH
jgi:hypothetical protein